MPVTPHQMEHLTALIARVDAAEQVDATDFVQLALHVKQLQLEVVTLNERIEELHRELARTRSDLLRPGTKHTA